MKNYPVWHPHASFSGPPRKSVHRNSEHPPKDTCDKRNVHRVNIRYESGAAALLTALRAVPLRPRERLTFEYVLLGGINDRLGDARELAQLARNSGLNVKVNLIVWNPGPEIPYQMPQSEDVAAFQQHLIAANVQLRHNP